jgi:hypothetical protein
MRRAWRDSVAASTDGIAQAGDPNHVRSARSANTTTHGATNLVTAKLTAHRNGGPRSVANARAGNTAGRSSPRIAFRLGVARLHVGPYLSRESGPRLLGHTRREAAVLQLLVRL